MKEYPNIQKALKLEMLCSDKENGIYLNEELASSLEERLDMANANEQSVAELSAKLQQTEQDIASNVEMAVKSANEELERTKTEYENTIAQLNAKLQETESLLKEKEEELNSMAATTAIPSTPAKPQHSSPKNNNWEDMSLAQKKSFFQNM